MHDLHLIDMEWSNFGQYGANRNRITFPDGLVRVVGPVGSGKSTIMDVLEFVLFGKSYRGVPLEELHNSANKKKAVGAVNLYREDSDGKNNYRVVRELTSSGSQSFNIYKNESPDPLDKKAGFSQQWFEDNVLGFSDDVFRLAVAQNSILTTSFMDLGAEKKRKLVDSITSTKSEKFRSKNASEMTKAHASFTNVTLGLSGVDRSIDDQKRIITVAENELKNNIQELLDQNVQSRVQLESLTNATDALNVQVSSIKTEGSTLQAQLPDLTSLSSESNKLSTALMFLNNMQSSRTEIARLESVYNQQVASLSELQKTRTDTPVISPDQVSILYNKISEDTKTAKSLQSELNTVSGNLQYIKNKLAEIGNQGKSVKSNIVCPACDRLITEQDAEKVKVHLREEYKKMLSQNETTQAIYDAKLTTIQALSASIQEVTAEYEKIKAQKDISDRLDQTITSKNREVLAANATWQNYLTSYTAQMKDISDYAVSNGGNANTPDVYFNSRLQQIEVIRVAASEIQKKINELTARLNDINTQISANSATKKQIENGIVFRTQQIEKMQRSDAENTLNAAKKQLDSLVLEKRKLESEKDTFSDEIEICKFLDDMYGENGIKKMLLSIYVPDFNDKIDKNLMFFDLPYKIKFDESMECEFEGFLGGAYSYKGLSQGQRRKLNVAVAMAFRDFVTEVIDFKINLLFLDEVVDGSQDDDGIGDMFDLMKGKTLEIGSIYVATHRSKEFSELFDHTASVTNDGLYSSVKML